MVFEYTKTLTFQKRRREEKVEKGAAQMKKIVCRSGGVIRNTNKEHKEGDAGYQSSITIT